MRPVVFMLSGRLGLIEAQDWYERVACGLAAGLREPVEVQVNRIAPIPPRFPKTPHDARRARLRRFPHGSSFRPRHDAIDVVARFHAGRDSPPSPHPETSPWRRLARVRDGSVRSAGRVQARATPNEGQAEILP